jgi:hypothetical protein
MEEREGQVGVSGSAQYALEVNGLSRGHWWECVGDTSTDRMKWQSLFFKHVYKWFPCFA